MELRSRKYIFEPTYVLIMEVITDSYKYRRIPGVRSSAKSPEGNRLDNLGKMVRFPT
jgi:hypothetical protein